MKSERSQKVRKKDGASNALLRQIEDLGFRRLDSFSVDGYGESITFARKEN